MPVIIVVVDLVWLNVGLPAKDVVIRLSGAHLSGANLRGATLTGADLSSAHLTGANLSRADLFRATLSGANLSYADLRGAHLTKADLRDADLSDALLENVRGLTQAQLDRACGEPGSPLGPAGPDPRQAMPAGYPACRSQRLLTCGCL